MLSIPGVTLVDASSEETREESILFYGHHGTGKSHLLADAIEYYASQGLKSLYVVLPGEDPFRTLDQFNLGAIVAKVDNLTGWEKLMRGIKPGMIDVIALDSLKSLNRMVMDHVLGKDRYPVDGKTEWPPVHDAFITAVGQWKDAARISLAVCPADRSSDSFLDPNTNKPNLITCDLPGKMAAGIQGAVGVVGYLEASLNEETKEFTRTISFVPSRRTLWRVNGLRRMITEPIFLDSFHGGYEKIQQVFAEHRKPIEGGADG